MSIQAIPAVWECKECTNGQVCPKNDNIKVTKKGNIKTTNIGYFFDRNKTM